MLEQNCEVKEKIDTEDKKRPVRVGECFEMIYRPTKANLAQAAPPKEHAGDLVNAKPLSSKPLS